MTSSKSRGTVHQNWAWAFKVCRFCVHAFMSRFLNFQSWQLYDIDFTKAPFQHTPLPWDRPPVLLQWKPSCQLPIQNNGKTIGTYNFMIIPRYQCKLDSLLKPALSVDQSCMHAYKAREYWSVTQESCLANLPSWYCQDQLESWILSLIWSYSSLNTKSDWPSTYLWMHGRIFPPISLGKPTPLCMYMCTMNIECIYM